MMFLKTRSHITFLWIIILLLAPAISWSQETAWELPVVVKALKTEKKLEGAVVTLSKSSSTVQSITTGSNGKAEFKLAPNGDYMISVTKAGHITKRFSISTYGVPDDRGKLGFGVFEFEVSIFVQAACGDYSILNQPIAKVKYDAKKEDFNFDMSYTNSILSKLEPLEGLEAKAKLYEVSISKADKQFAAKDYKGAISEYKAAKGHLACEKYPDERIVEAEKLLAELDKGKEKEKQYNDAMAAGENALKSKDYSGAQSSFNKALEVKPGDKAANDKIAEVEKQKKANEDVLAKEKQYSEAMAAGNTAKDGKNYTAALDSYQKALGIKAGDAPATAKIKEVEGLIKAEKDIAEKEKQYSDAMAAGNTAKDGKKYTDALASYQKALSVKANDAPATAKIKEVEGLINAEKDALAKEKEYNDAMAAGNTAKDGKNYTAALTSYQKALSLKANDGPATAKIKEVEGLINADKAAQAKEKEYADAMAAGSSSLEGKKYNDALASYKKALGIKANDGPATAKIKEVEGLINADLTAQQKEKEYQAAMAAGNTSLSGKKYSDALASFKKAEGIKSGDAEAKAKIAEVEGLINAEKDALAKEKQYSDAMAAGNTSKTGKKYSEALTSYQKALEIKPGDAAAQAKITEVQGLMGAEEIAKQKEEQYKAAMTEGNTAKDAKSYTAAIDAYKKALGIKANDGPATAKIKEVEGLMNIEKNALAKEKDYADALKAGDDAKDAKNYTAALASYKKAEGMKPAEQLPKDKQKEVQALIDAAKGAELEAKYADLIKQADSKFDANDLGAARTLYVDASKLKDKEQHPKTRITEIDKQLGDIKNKELLEKQYADAMKAGNTSLGAKKYTDALASFKKAESLKSGDAEAKAKIAEVEGLIEAEKTALAKEKQYSDAMTAGNTSKTAKKYSEALTSYQKALEVKPGDATAQAKITEVQGMMGAEEIAKQKEEQYKAAMAEGNSAKEAKSYTAAIDAYKKALDIKANDAPATAKIKEVEGLIKNDLAGQQKEKDYADALKAGDDAKDAKNYTAALASYKKAEGMKPAEQLPKDKQKEVQALIDAAKGAELEARYADLIKQADGQFDAKELAAARVLYVEASKVKAGEAHPKTRITEIDKQLGDIKNKELVEKQYADAMKAGNTSSGAKKYNEALASFKKAESLKPGDAEAAAKIKEVEGLIASDIAAKEKEKQYTDAMTAGNTSKTAKKYTEALTSYQKALDIKPGDAAAQAKITEVQGMMGAEEIARQKEEQYKAAMVEGNAAKDGKQYTAAIDAYKKALTIKANDAPATAKIKEVEGLIKNEGLALQKEKDYADALKAGDDAKDAKNYTAALASYKKAESMKPSEQLPKDKQKEVQALIDGEKTAQMDAKYAEALKQGDDLKDAKKYPEAIAAYKKAEGMRPAEQLPKDKQKEVQALIDGEKTAQMDAKYAEALKQGDDLKDAKKYPEAIASYKKAEGMKPSEQLPKDKQAEVKRMMDEDSDKALTAKYTEVIKKADDAFTAKDYTVAKASYTEAAKLKTTEQHPKSRLTEIEGIEKGIADAKALDQKYAAAMSKAAGLLSTNKLNEAKTAYQSASDLKPAEQEPKDKIADINKTLDEQLAAKKKEEDYKASMAKGQKHFTAKEWLNARNSYREALTAKPGDATAQAKFDECVKKLKENPPKNLEAEYMAARKNGDAAFQRGEYKNAVAAYKDGLNLKPGDGYCMDKVTFIEELMKYSEGTTVKTKKVGGCNVEERIVVKDNNIYVYSKKIWDWGGVFWFKNDVSITEAIFEAETTTTNQ